MATRDMPKACVILGAGASFDVRGRQFTAQRPPLARELFSHGSSEQILARYKEARFLALRLNRVVSNGERAIEDALLDDARHQDPEIRKKFKELPAYFRDLVFEALRPFTAQPAPHVELIRKLLSDSPHRVLFIVLNYDDLTEVPLIQYDRERFDFSSLPGYTADEQAKVIPLHGSIHWFKFFEAQTVVRPNWANEVREFDIFEEVAETDIYIRREGINDVTSMYNFDNVEPNKFLYPLVTAPLTGKKLVDGDCPGSLRDTAEEFLGDCHKFLIVGTSGLDGDLFELINRGIRDNFPDPMVHVVGVEPVEAFDQFAREIVEFRNRIDPDVSKFNNGFVEYVCSNDFDQFLSA